MLASDPDSVVPPTSPGSTDADALKALAAAVQKLSDPAAYNLQPDPSPTAVSMAPECDIVMKGGITSGVVYPLAVCQLATRQQLRSIGGSSAGAIAAVAAAAAEYRRGQGSPDGFVRLAALPGWLGSHLSGLFQPAPSTVALYRLVYAATGAGNKAFRLLSAALKASIVKVGLGMAPALLLGLAGILLLIPALGRGGWGIASILGIALVSLLLAVLVLVGAAAGVCFALWTCAREQVPGNFFGLCRGHRPAQEPATEFTRGPALTDWMAAELDKIAGLTDRTLTFGDLWGPDAVAAAKQLDEPGAQEAGPLQIDAARAMRRIDLLITTTNLSHGVADYIPFAYTPGHHSRLLYCEADIEQFFPPGIVAHLRAVSEDATVDGKPVGCPDHPRQLTFMPRPWDLPVVIAARLSLSFPGLLSAVRLYELLFDGSPPPAGAQPDSFLVEGDQVRWRAAAVWFSDGGICSNFPVHFFDSMLPSRPTYGFDLTPYPAQGSADDVQPIPPPGGGAASRYDGIGMQVGAFGRAIADTMQNNRDTAMALLPGFRDRIAHIRHTAKEGGLNLQMQPAVIARLALRGQLAAEYLQGGAGVPGGGFNWPRHRFTRYRMAMAGLQRSIGPMVQRIEVPPPDPAYRTFLGDYDPTTYNWRPGREDAAESALDALVTLGQAWDDAGQPFLTSPPRPLPDLRWQPPV
jgi:predicted acylesterase/phospholipase RssA